MEGIQIVGVFDDATEARLAAQKLQDAGIERDAIRVRGGGSIVPEHVESGGTIRNFFAELFGSGAGKDDREPEDFPGDYAEAVRRGGSVLLVEARDDDECDRIVGLLDDSGAIDIDERVGRWRSEGYSRHDEAASPYSEEEVAAERARYGLAGAPVADEEREAMAERRHRLRVHRRQQAATAMAGNSAIFGEVQKSLDEVRAERAEPPPGVQRASQREPAMAARDRDDRPAARAVDVGGAEATGAAWSAAPGQRRTKYDGPERRSTAELPYTGIERRGPAQ